MTRKRTLGDASDPLSTSNVIVATEGPHQVLDIKGSPINIARKPWSVVSDFLFQFGDGGLIFSMMDGLSPTTLAAIQLGSYDVVAFESNSVTWHYAQEVVAAFIDQQKKKEKAMFTRIKGSLEVCS